VKENELELLRRLYRGIFSEDELVDLFQQNRDKYRVLLHLVQQPKFPERLSLGIIPKLYPMDLIRVVKNKRTNPFVRKRTEQEFANKYPRFPLGEKLSYMKIIPASMLDYFIEEKDSRVLEVILNNPYCTADAVLKMINRYTPRYSLYNALFTTEWYKRPQVAEAIAHDDQAPIRILTTIIPYLNIRQLEKLYGHPDTHQNVKNSIITYLQQRNRKQERGQEPQQNEGSE